MKFCKSALVVTFFSAFLSVFISICEAGNIRELPLRCSVGSFDSQNVQLLCGAGYKQKRQMNRAYFEKVYGDPTEGKLIKINMNNTENANQLKSY